MTSTSMHRSVGGRIVRALILLVAAMAPATAPLAQERTLPTSRSQMMQSFAPVVRNALPAVVNVQASRRVEQNSFFGLEADPFFRRFFEDRGFGRPRERQQSSLGSGVIVSSDGVVITNNHVIKGATEIRIALSDKREFDAEVILKDEQTDLAVLRMIDGAGDFPALELGDSDALEVGDLVLAIGNPFGVGQTVTSGIVSALARTQAGISDYQFFIQTDAAINPGNSGGALVDMNGRLIGINTAIFSRSGGSNGIGFAIPANMARVVIDSALSGGKIQRPWLGAGLQSITPEIALSLGLDRPVGALISDIYENSPASRGGLETGDVILTVDGEEVDDPQELYYRLTTRGIGGTASLTVLRRGREIPVSLTLEVPPEVPPRNETTITGRSPFEGATVGNLSPALASEQRLGLESNGVIVLRVEPGSWAHQVRFRPGDIVRYVNGEQIERVSDLVDITQTPSRTWALGIERKGRLIKVVLRG